MAIHVRRVLFGRATAGILSHIAGRVDRRTVSSKLSRPINHVEDDHEDKNTSAHARSGERCPIIVVLA